MEDKSLDQEPYTDDEPLDAEAHTLDADVDGLRDVTASLTFDGQHTHEHSSSLPNERNLAYGGEDPEDANLVEKPIAEDVAFEGRFLSLNRLKTMLPNGNIGERDVVRHPGAVGIVALDDFGHIALVRQWRAALGRVTVEIPAGKLDPGEDPLECATRELREETGYTANKIAYLTTIAPAAGYSDELIHLYMATGLSFVGSDPDDDEFINVDLVDVSELIDGVLDGRIEDAKTIVGALVVDAVAHRLSAKED